MTSSATHKNLTKGECRYSRDLAAAGVGIDGLLANSSAALKQELDRAADYCAGYFADQLFPVAS